MDQELLGYLLDSLDAETNEAVERHLETSADARRKLMALRKAIAPLTYDSDPPPPPQNLVFNTLRRIAEAECKPKAANSSVARLPSPSRAMPVGGWRRPDVLIAASIALLGLLMVPPALILVREQHHRVACANNLRDIYGGLAGWASTHGGKLPGPDEKGPLARAGMVMVRLNEDSQRPNEVRKWVNCPANGVKDPPEIPTAAELENLYHKNRAAYEDLVRKMGGCYAYRMGHVDKATGRLIPVSIDDDKMTPIVADRPPRPEDGVGWNVKNSPNHGGRGQNVLHLGGNVQFLPSRFIDKDDIYLNKKRWTRAGEERTDHVLAPSEAVPMGD